MPVSNKQFILSHATVFKASSMCASTSGSGGIGYSDSQFSNSDDCSDEKIISFVQA
jgi:hypothetical protein